MTKKTTQTLAAVAILLAALGGLGWTLVAAPTLPLATLSLMEGDVKIERAGAVLPAAEGQALLEKDKVVTGKGRAEVQFADGTTLRTSEETRVQFGQAPKAGGLLRSIELSLGNLWFKVNKVTQAADARTEFLTPTAIAAVRGTEGEIRVAAGGHSQFALASGFLDVRNKKGLGRTERIAAYQMVEVAPGKPATSPVPYTPRPAPLIRNLGPGEHRGEAEARVAAGGAAGIRPVHEGEGRSGGVQGEGVHPSANIHAPRTPAQGGTPAGPGAAAGRRGRRR